MRGTISATLVLGGLLAFGMSLGAAPSAMAEQPNIYGLVTADESREISASGPTTCAMLDRSAATASLTPDDVSLLIDDYLGQGWDLESTGDILRESVDRTCGEYLPQVALALTSYGLAG
jgi:hypothetical protein